MSSPITLTERQQNCLREVDMSMLKVGDRIFRPSLGTTYRTGGPSGLLNFNPGEWSNPVVAGTLFTLTHSDDSTMTFRREDDGALQSGPINPTRKLLKMGAAR